MSSRAPIRVCQVVGKMRAGGVESFLMNYYRRIDRSHIQFDFVIDEDSPNHELVPEIEALGGRVIEVPRYQDLHRYLPAMEGLFRREGWPIVHSQINALSVFPLMAAKRAGVPVRVAHSHTALAKGEPLRNGAKVALRQFANVYPTHRAACGVDAGRWLFGRGQAFTVIPNAIELGRFAFDPFARAAVRRELGVGNGEMLFGHVGRFMTQKNHGFLLELFSRISEADPTARLALAGEGPLEGEMRVRAASLGILDEVLFLGQRGDAERLYSAFDAFVLPSLYEGFPVVAIEAQASGLPCVIADSVTSEASIGGSVTYLPLSAGAERWAGACVDAVASARREAAAVSPALAPYDIWRAAPSLTEYYERALAEVRA